MVSPAARSADTKNNNDIQLAKQAHMQNMLAQNMRKIDENIKQDNLTDY